MLKILSDKPPVLTPLWNLCSILGLGPKVGEGWEDLSTGSVHEQGVEDSRLDSVFPLSYATPHTCGRVLQEMCRQQRLQIYLQQLVASSHGKSNLAVPDSPKMVHLMMRRKPPDTRLSIVPATIFQHKIFNLKLRLYYLLS